MKLNHINLTVDDVSSAFDFFETYFGFQAVDDFPKNDKMAFMRGDDGFVLSLMNLQDDSEVSYPGMFHIGFIQESEEEVDAINERLRSAGFNIKPPRDFHGSYTFYMKAPGGFTLEVQKL